MSNVANVIMNNISTKTLVHILVVSNDQPFINRIKDLVDHPQVVVDSNVEVNGGCYDFYILEGSIEITKAVDKIRKLNESSPVYLSGSVCESNVPVRKIMKCNLVDCLETDECLRKFVKKVESFRKHQNKMNQLSSKLDSLKAGDLKSLTMPESDKFVDYIQNHPLPMVLVNQEGEVLHANKAMEDMIGIKLPGVPASVCWDDAKEFEKTLSDLKEKGQLLNREVTLKTVDGKRVLMKLYISIHSDNKGNWINTRCLFVPEDSTD